MRTESSASPPGADPGETLSGFGTPAESSRRSEPTSGFGMPAAPREHTPAEPAGVASRPRTPPATARSAPLPKRPKGRLLVGSVILGLCSTAILIAWDSWFRYRAYGVVTGRIIHVSAPWGGIVQSLHAREGQTADQGQILVTLDNLQLAQQMDRLGDELKIAQARLDADMAQYRWQTHQLGDQTQKALAEYYEMWGNLLQERSKLSELESDLNRSRGLAERGAVSTEELERLEFTLSGQQSKVDKLEIAVDEMKKRAQGGSVTAADLSGQVKPQLARIESLQTELACLRDQLDQGHIRSPVNGRVIRTLRFTGEYADVGQDILEVLEQGSIEVVLYVGQEHAGTLEPGAPIDVIVEPSGEPLRCVVQRFGEQLVPVPKELQRYYGDHRKLVPVYLRPGESSGGEGMLRLGSEVKLPFQWKWAFWRP